MATLKEIQNCELEILKAVAKVCDDNKINYYLAAGTFLGAVRHKGFIPWDDDIDIYIKNSDLKKLKRKCKKELPKKYFWQDHRTDRGTPYMMTKIRNVNTYMPESENANTNQGIWLDIFPLINAAENFKLEKQVYYISKYQYYLSNQIKLFKTHYSSVISMVYRIARELLIYRPLTCYYYRRAIDLGTKKSGKLIALDVSFFGNCDDKMVNIARRKSYRTDMFDDIDYYAFEDTVFMGVKDFDEYLSMLFGKDYMIPKQYSHFSDYSNVVVDQ